jgi:hypothetical protein
MNGLNRATLPNVHTADRVIAQDDEIVSAARAGAPKAFAELHALYSRRLYNTIIAITKSPEGAEDALQETFLRVHLAIHTFEGQVNRLFVADPDHRQLRADDTSSDFETSQSKAIDRSPSESKKRIGLTK